MSSSDLLLTRGKSVSKDNHDINSVKFISHNNSYSRKRLGSILTQGVGSGLGRSVGSDVVSRDDEGGIASVDLKIHHHHMFNTTSSAVKGMESLDVVTVKKNELYDMRILSDNPRGELKCSNASIQSRASHPRQMFLIFLRLHQHFYHPKRSKYRNQSEGTAERFQARSFHPRFRDQLRPTNKSKVKHDVRSQPRMRKSKS